MFTTSFLLKYICFIHHRTCWHLSLGVSNLKFHCFRGFKYVIAGAVSCMQSSTAYFLPSCQFVWKNLDLDRVYRPHCVLSVLKTSVDFFYTVLDELAIVERLLGNLSKPRRRWQRERCQTKGFVRRTMAVHVQYKSLYISLPSSAKDQCEMTKF